MARNVATKATLEVLTADANGTDRQMINDTIRGYLSALAQLFVTDDVPAWRPSLRSKARLRSAAVRHLADPSLAAAIMNASPGRLIADLNWMGFLFESLVIRDLRVYADALELASSTTATATDLKWTRLSRCPMAVGPDLRSSSAPRHRLSISAAANLAKLADLVEGEPPACLAVICGTGYGLTRDDGVLQIPIGALAA